MKEYTLIIKGEMDFIILSPQVLSSLITQIHNSPERKVVVSIESIMPPKFTDYLLRVINSNRFSNERQFVIADAAFIVCTKSFG